MIQPSTRYEGIDKVPPVFEPVEAAFHDVTLTVDLRSTAEHCSSITYFTSMRTIVNSIPGDSLAAG